MSAEIVIRAPELDDEPFIGSAWLRGASEAWPWALTPRARYVPQQLAHMARCRALGATVVACHPDAPDELIGFACYQLLGGDLVVHWIYVRGCMRRLGVAQQLLEHAQPGARRIVATGWARACERWQTRERRGERRGIVDTLRARGVELLYDPALVAELRPS